MEDSDDELLATRRPKRSTAGNRMEAALAEMTLNEPPEAEDDEDFAPPGKEEGDGDIYESDFQSTDEEAANDFDGEGEKTVQEEEDRLRKIMRARTAMATAAAHARQRATFNPQAEISASKKPQRRVSFQFAANAETGEVMAKGGKRHSKRKHTVLNTSATVKRLRHAEERRASFVKKVKIQERIPTQAELIARALDNEEGNIFAHRNYLKFEEERRKRAQVVRTTIQGPLLRWISRKEGVKVADSLPAQPSTSHYNTHRTDTTAPIVGVGAHTDLSQPLTQHSLYGGTPSSAKSADLPMTSLSESSIPLPDTQTSPTDWTETVCKNYVVHELGQYDAVPQASWKDTMAAMFGDHVRWEDLRVYVTKGRPLTRPKQMCLMTGLPARYLDPQTNVPFANVQAYRTLARVLSHEFIWDERLACYVGTEHDVCAQGIKLHDDSMNIH